MVLICFKFYSQIHIKANWLYSQKHGDVILWTAMTLKLQKCYVTDLGGFSCLISSESVFFESWSCSKASTKFKEIIPGEIHAMCVDMLLKCIPW